jgi:hypothetical protein
MLEKDSVRTIRPFDLARVCWYLEDPILYFLVGKELGTLFAELDAIPDTRYFPPVLSWTLRHYLGEIQSLRARRHIAALTRSADEASLERIMARLRTETFVLLKQIEMQQDKYKGIPVS